MVQFHAEHLTSSQHVCVTNDWCRKATIFGDAQRLTNVWWAESSTNIVKEAGWRCCADELLKAHKPRMSVHLSPSVSFFFSFLHFPRSFSFLSLFPNVSFLWKTHTHTLHHSLSLSITHARTHSLTHSLTHTEHSALHSDAPVRSGLTHTRGAAVWLFQVLLLPDLHPVAFPGGSLAHQCAFAAPSILLRSSSRGYVTRRCGLPHQRRGSPSLLLSGRTEGKAKGRRVLGRVVSCRGLRFGARRARPSL